MTNIESTENIKTLTKEACDHLASDIKLSYDDRHDAEYTYADISKTIVHIGYEPTHAIRKGHSTFIERYQGNR